MSNISFYIDIWGLEIIMPERYNYLHNSQYKKIMGAFMNIYQISIGYLFYFLLISLCFASNEEDWEFQEALKQSQELYHNETLNEEDELQLALFNSLEIKTEKPLIFPIKNFEIDNNIVSKVIMLPGGLEIGNSFMYNSTQTKKPLPTVCHINYYNTEMYNGFPLIISGKIENVLIEEKEFPQYLQIVCQVKPLYDPQEGGLLIRPHYALHKSDKSLNYKVSYTCYDHKDTKRMSDMGSQNVNTHASGNDGSVASPNNMSTDIDKNRDFSLFCTIIKGHNDFTGGEMVLKTYHILLSDMSEIYKVSNQFLGEIDLKWLFPKIQKELLFAGAPQESITRFFEEIDRDLKIYKKN